MTIARLRKYVAAMRELGVKTLHIGSTHIDLWSPTAPAAALSPEKLAELIKANQCACGHDKADHGPGGCNQLCPIDKCVPASELG